MMADNVAITEGSGKTIASDEVAGVNYQQVKLADGTLESTTPIAAGTGVSTNAMRVTMANDSATMGVYLASTAGTVNVALKPGTIAVQFDPGHTLGAVTQSGTFAVYFDQSNPAVNVGTPTITGITNSVNVLLKPGTIAVSLDPGHLLGAVTANAGTGTMTVVFDPGHELGSIKGSNSSIAVFFDRANPNVLANAGTGTFNVQFDPGHTLGTVLVNPGTGTINVQLDPGHTIGKVDAGAGTFTIKTDPGYTLGKVDQGVTNTTGWLMNMQGTASLFTVSGSTSGISVSGVTLISPSANASFKIYAFSLQTTGQVSLTTKFTNGSGGSPTEFFRPLITASGVTGAQGANLASQPGFPLFVTGVSTTLALVLDTATLVHYSVSYTKESA